MKLQAGQSICLAARGPSRLLVSRQGEPHFRAAVGQGLLKPWPLITMLSQWSLFHHLNLTKAAGRTMIPDGGSVSAPAVIVPADIAIAGTAIDTFRCSLADSKHVDHLEVA